jgi:serine/threonine protein kinase/tetratricopeptide (TPR) repeat protein
MALPDSNATSMLVFVDQICNDFEDSWKKGERPRIETFLTKVPDSAQTLALRELIALDVACRARSQCELGSKEIPTAEEYQARFPNHTDVISDVFSQIKNRAPTVAAGPPTGGQDESPSAPTVLEGEDSGEFAASTRMRTIQSSGSYQVLEPIGQGGLGRVYLAEDARIGRKVAVKEMREAARASAGLVRRFKEEAQITGLLEHPNVVPIYELGQLPDGSPYYAMRLLGRTTLRDSLRIFHGLPVDSPEKALKQNEILRAFVSICQAVAFAHSRKILHRDLKPANVVLGDFGEVFVLDWGLAKILDAGDRPDEMPAFGRLQGDSHATSSEGSVLGTPAYMSPEQAHGHNDHLGPRSDVFSLGAILYEILVGHAPYQGKTTLEILSKAQKADYRNPRTLDARIPRALEAVCMKALAASPEQRYAGADEIMRWQAGEPVLAYPEPWHTRATRWAKRHRTACWTSLATVMTVLLALGLWVWREDRRVKALRAEIVPQLFAGQRLLSEGNAHGAMVEVSKVHARIADEPALADVRLRVHELLHDAEKRIRVQEAIEADRQLLVSFRTKRDEALFVGSLLANHDLASSLRQARQTADEGLGLYQVAGDAFRRPDLAARHYTAQEKQEIESACRELMLIRIGALAQPLPEQEEKERHANARAALEVLGQPALTESNLLTAQLLRGKCHLLLGESEKGNEILHRAKQQTPVDATDAFFAGMEAFYANQYDEARGRFSVSLRQNPAQFWSQYFLAVCHLQNAENSKESAAQAIAHLSACLDRRPDFIWNYLLRGAAYGQLKDFDAAEADFQKASDLGPKEYALYVNRGGMRMRQEKLDDAAKDLRRAVDLAPQRHQAYLNLAELEFRRGQLPEAMRLIDKAIELAPLLAQAYSKRARFRAESNELKGALADLDQAAHLETPGSLALARIHGERGRLLHRLGDFKLARAAYDAALTRAELKEVLALRAFTLLELNLADLARKDLDAFISQSQPTEMQRSFLWQAHAERGHLRAVAAEHLGAMEDFVQTVALAPHPDALKKFERDRVAFIRGRRGWAFLVRYPQLAAEDFDKALAADPKAADLYNGRGFARVLSGKVDEGLKDAETAVALAEPHPPMPKAGVYINAAGAFAQAIPWTRFRSNQKNVDSIVQKQTERSLRLLQDARALVSGADRALVLQDIRDDPAFDPLRDLAEFKKIVTP